jgi:hypothetical protein
MAHRIHLLNGYVIKSTIVVGLFFRPIKYAAHVTRWTLSVPLRLDVFEIFDLCCLFVFIYMSCHESTFCKPLSCKLFSFRYHWSDLFFVLTIWVIRIFFIDMNGLPLASTCAKQMYFLVRLVVLIVLIFCVCVFLLCFVCLRYVSCAECNMCLWIVHSVFSNVY